MSTLMMCDAAHGWGPVTEFVLPQGDAVSFARHAPASDSLDHTRAAGVAARLNFRTR